MSPTNILVMAMLAALGLACADAAQSVLRRSRGWRRWAGGLALALPALTLITAVAVLGRGAVYTFLPRSVPLVSLPPPLPSGADPTPLLARGEHIARTTCMACHSPDFTLPLRGGNSIAEVIDVGDLHPPNLTPAGAIATWSDREIARAIRNGVGPEGRRLVAMPTERLRNLADDDLAAVIAYLRAQPPVARDLPAYQPWMVLFVLRGFNVITDTAPVLDPVAAPRRGPDAAYGEYLFSYMECRDCHGDRLDGVVKDHMTRGGPLRRVRDWTEAEFAATMRTGLTPGGRRLQPPMAWQAYGSMDDVELAAMYAYLKTVQ